MSRLDLACERTVVAGEPIKLYVKSTGGADSKWRVCLVHPGRSAIRWDIEAPYTGAVRYGCREIMAGKKSLGGKKAKIRVISFETFPDDGGKLLGVLVEKPDYKEFQHTFWVAVSEVPPRLRTPPPELPPDHPLADPMVRSFLGDLTEVAEENWRREQGGGGAAP